MSSFMASLYSYSLPVDRTYHAIFTALSQHPSSSLKSLTNYSSTPRLLLTYIRP